MSEKPRFFSKTSVINWYESRKPYTTMQTYEAPLGDLAPWEFTRRNGTVHTMRNPDKAGNPRFFELAGVKVSTSGREVDSFGQPGIREVADPSDPDGAVGTVGLLVDKRTGKVLLQVAPEPFAAPTGSPASEYLMIRASLQGSYSNIAEHKVPFSDRVDLRTYDNIIVLNPSRADGEVRVGITYVDGRKIDLSKQQNYKWFSKRQIDKAIRNNARVNGALTAALTVYEAKHKFRYRLPFFSIQSGKTELEKKAKKRSQPHGKLAFA